MKEVSFEWLNPKILSRDSKLCSKIQVCLKAVFFFVLPLFRSLFAVMYYKKMSKSFIANVSEKGW